MKKKPLQPPPGLDEEEQARFLELIQSSTGAGMTPISDHGFWLTAAERAHGKWFDALQQVDRLRSLQPLLDQLQPLVPPAVYPHLDDLARRYQLQHVAGAPRTPSYNRSAAHVRWAVYAEEIRVRPRGESASAAIARLAARDGIDTETLDRAYRGARGDMRKKRRQRKL